MKLTSRLVAPSFAKILDLTHADTLQHEADLSPFLPPGTMGIWVKCIRVAGTGHLYALPNSLGVTNVTIGSGGSSLTFFCPIRDQVLTYNLSVSGDDWDVWLVAYIVEKRTR